MSKIWETEMNFFDISWWHQLVGTSFKFHNFSVMQDFPLNAMKNGINFFPLLGGTSMYIIRKEIIIREKQ